MVNIISNILTKNANKHEKTHIATRRHGEVINTSVTLLVTLVRWMLTKSKPMELDILNIVGAKHLNLLVIKNY